MDEYGDLMIEAFVFDIDGTLADTYPVIKLAFNRFALKYLGKEWTLEEIVAQFGPPETEIIARQVKPALRDEAVEYYYRCYEELHDGTPLFDGIAELISELTRHGKKPAIFTGKGRRSTEITLAKLGLEGRFGPVVTGDDVGRGKPHPEGLLKAVEGLGVSPERAAMVGDHRSDILAGRAAGVFTIAALWHGYDNVALMEVGPHRAFETPQDMLKSIRNGTIGGIKI